MEKNEKDKWDECFLDLEQKSSVFNVWSWAIASGNASKGIELFPTSRHLSAVCPLIIPKRSRMPFGEGMGVPQKRVFWIILNQELFKFLQSLQWLLFSNHRFCPGHVKSPLTTAPLLQGLQSRACYSLKHTWFYFGYGKVNSRLQQNTGIFSHLTGCTNAHGVEAEKDGKLITIHELKKTHNLFFLTFPKCQLCFIHLFGYFFLPKHKRNEIPSRKPQWSTYVRSLSSANTLQWLCLNSVRLESLVTKILLSHVPSIKMLIPWSKMNFHGVFPSALLKGFLQYLFKAYLSRSCIYLLTRRCRFTTSDRVSISTVSWFPQWADSQPQEFAFLLGRTQSIVHSCLLQVKPPNLKAQVMLHSRSL